MLKSKVRGFDGDRVKSELSKLDTVMKLENNETSYKDQAMFYFGEAYQHDFIIAGSLILLFCLLTFIWKKIKKVSWVVAAIALSIVPFMSYHFYFKNINCGILLEKANLRTGPSKIFEVEVELKPGTRIVVGKRFKNWRYIVSPKSFEGWIAQDKIGFY